MASTLAQKAAFFHPTTYHVSTILDKLPFTYYADFIRMNFFAKDHLYPAISIERIKNPSRFYAIPILGFFIKCLTLIPQFFELFFLGIAAFFIVLVINPFVVLFTGKYWDVAYELSYGVIKFSTKIYFYLMGLTNTYPGFDFTIHDDYKIEIHKPSHPNRWLAIPLFGLIARIILLIPFSLYENVIRYASYFGVMGASFVVLFQGRYPESSYELARDGVRLNLAQSMYILGLTDRYPSFWISMNHKTIKWILIILALLYTLANTSSSLTAPKANRENENNMYYQNEIENNGAQYQTTPADINTGY